MSGNGLNFATRPDILRKAVAATRQCSICDRPVRASMLAPHENRHRVERESKPCEQCDEPIYRVARYGARQWLSQRFCSPRCRSVWLANASRIPLEDSYKITDAGCWEWTRSVTSDGYGQARRRDVRGNTGAHRVVYSELVGPIPEGMTLDHLCRNTRCVNPAHLEPVTLAENIRRASAIRTSCRQGHPLDGRRTDGTRYCLTCHREREVMRREARRVRQA